LEIKFPVRASKTAAPRFLLSKEVTQISLPSGEKAKPLGEGTASTLNKSFDKG